jgi:hypothetical protein
MNDECHVGEGERLWFVEVSQSVDGASSINTIKDRVYVTIHLHRDPKPSHSRFNIEQKGPSSAHVQTAA